MNAECLKMLVCPFSKTPLTVRTSTDKNGNEFIEGLVSESSGVLYQVNQGIPDLRPSTASRLQMEKEE